MEGWSEVVAAADKAEWEGLWIRYYERAKPSCLKKSGSQVKLCTWCVHKSPPPSRTRAPSPPPPSPFLKFIRLITDDRRFMTSNRSSAFFRSLISFFSLSLSLCECFFALLSFVFFSFLTPRSFRFETIL